MHKHQGWKTLSKLTQGLSSHVTTVGVYRQTPVRQTSSHTGDTKALKTRYDVVIIGAGHNGLVAAAYLQKAGLDVCVLERRHLVGGAAVTEEIVPGFKFSRASYVLSLFRPEITRDLELKKHGLAVYLRDPYSYTPVLESSKVVGGRPRSLLLQRDPLKNRSQIAQFSHHDAQVFPAYEASLSRMVDAIQPLIDLPPVDVNVWMGRSLRKQWHNWPSLRALMGTGQRLGRDIPAFYEFLTAPAAKVLDKWFESEPLKATLGTDACIGAMTSPYIAGSGYVLLHHVMGELEGQKGAWGYVKGGMGALSEAIAGAARAHGASIFTHKTVSEIAVDEGSGRARAVVLNDGTEICSNIILSNVTAKITFLDLLEKFSANLPHDFLQSVSHIDYTSPVAKINVAVNKLPNFLADPNEKGDTPLPHHRGTVHINCENMSLIHEAYLDALQGRCSHRPVIEMTIPSSIDPTLAPPGCHVIQLFVQYVPYTLVGGQQWTEQLKEEFADRVFNNIEDYAPGFKGSIVGCDILTPPDLERIFGLTGGNIFQGAMSMDQLFFMRPTPFNSDYRTPLPGLYMCGSAAHPGGGVMGSAGRLAALAILDDRQRN